MVWRQFDINQCRAHNLIKQPLQSWIKMYIDRVTILSLCLINSKYLDHRVHHMSVFLPSEQKFFTWSICFYFCFFSWFLTYISTICVLGKTIRLSILRPRQNVKCLVMLWFLTALQPVSKYCRLVLIFHGESKHNNTAFDVTAEARTALSVLCAPPWNRGFDVEKKDAVWSGRSAYRRTHLQIVTVAPGPCGLQITGFWEHRHTAQLLLLLWYKGDMREADFRGSIHNAASDRRCHFPAFRNQSELYISVL